MPDQTALMAIAKRILAEPGNWRGWSGDLRYEVAKLDMASKPHAAPVAYVRSIPLNEPAIPAASKYDLFVELYIRRVLPISPVLPITPGVGVAF